MIDGVKFTFFETNQFCIYLAFVYIETFSAHKSTSFALKASEDPEEEEQVCV